MLAHKSKVALWAGVVAVAVFSISFLMIFAGGPASPVGY
jgi:hypothetical protein